MNTSYARDIKQVDLKVERIISCYKRTDVTSSTSSVPHYLVAGRQYFSIYKSLVMWEVLLQNLWQLPGADGEAVDEEIMIHTNLFLRQSFMTAFTTVHFILNLF